MARREFIPRNWREHPHAGAPNLTILRSEDPITGTEYEYTLDVLSSALVRTTFTSTRHPLEPHPFLATAPPRTIATALPTTSTPTRKTITLPGLRADDPTRTLTLDWSSTPTVCTSSPPYADLPLRSWAADGAGVSHYSAYDASGASLYFGLGEKAAPLDLRARTFSVSASDAFGYDAHRSDPLYKHVPWLVRASSAGCAGILWASRARGSVSVGGEMDGLWGRYVAYRQQVGGAEGFLVFGADMAALMRAYAALVGRPRLVPRWALGYVAGGMRYSMSDDPPADGVILGFVDRCARERIPCSAFQLSSGYTVAERPPRTRNVFTWNRRRFRDPGAWVAGMRRRGVRVVANLKPYVLRCHPAYDALEAAGALFVDPRTGRAAVTRLWSAGGGESEDGSHLDFTAREAWEWWRGGVAGIRALGIEGIWNDNNEYTIPDDDWVCAADLPLLQDGLRTAVRSTPGEATDGDRSVGVWTRAVHSELMARCSFEAAQSVAAGERTYVLTRSATPGAMRFACSTWSGDNTSSWDDFAGSVAMTQAAGLSLFPSYGHDTGGFAGRQPSAALLTRWVQTACHTARLAINTYKTTPEDNLSGAVTEPWQYPSHTPFIRAAIRRRYALLPLLASLQLVAHRTGAPVVRWVGWGCERSDPRVWTDRRLRDAEGQFCLGGDVLVAAVDRRADEAGEVDVYLPRTALDGGGSEEAVFPGYVLLAGAFPRYAAGQWVRVPCPIAAGAPVLAREGSAIPVGRDERTLGLGESPCGTPPPSNGEDEEDDKEEDEDEHVARLPRDDYRAVELYPPLVAAAAAAGDEEEEQGGGTVGARWWTTTWFEEDGCGPDHARDVLACTVSYSCSRGRIALRYAERYEACCDDAAGDGGGAAGERFVPAWSELVVILPPGEERPVVAAEGSRPIHRLGDHVSASDVRQARFVVAVDRGSSSMT